MTTWLNRLRNRDPAFQTAILAGVLLGALAATVPIALHLRGGIGVLTAAVAAGVCLAGAATALGISRIFGSTQHALISLSGSMLARTGIPLFAGVGIHLGGGPLAEAGFIYYLLVFYPVALTAETYLSLPQKRPPDCPQP